MKLVIEKFSNFRLNESELNEFRKLTGEVTLYRLTSHPVVDLSEPGEYYVCDKKSISPDLLDKKGSEMFLLTVTCNADNIDDEKSQMECDSKGNKSIVAVKDDSKCKFIGVAPYLPA